MLELLSQNFSSGIIPKVQKRYLEKTLLSQQSNSPPPSCSFKRLNSTLYQVMKDVDSMKNAENTLDGKIQNQKEKGKPKILITRHTSCYEYFRIVKKFECGCYFLEIFEFKIIGIQEHLDPSFSSTKYRFNLKHRTK